MDVNVYTMLISMTGEKTDEVPNLMAARITALREKKGWSMRMLGERAGTSGAYISQLERGAMPKPGAKLLQQIADALGVSVVYLMEGKEAPDPITEMLLSLPPERAAEMAEFVEEAIKVPPELLQNIMIIMQQFRRISEPPRSPRRYTKHARPDEEADDDADPDKGEGFASASL